MMLWSRVQVVLILALILRTCGSLPALLPLPTDLRGRRGNPTGMLEGCGPCNLDQCPQNQGCKAGLVPDSCGCCKECGNLEGQICDPGTQTQLYGLCGTGLRCEWEKPEGEGGAVEGGGWDQVCVCEEQELVCGSDGRTYRNMCRFREAAHVTSELETRGRGPCQTVPVIKIPPRGRVYGTGSSLNFLCEVFAYPLAQVEWRKEGQEVVLPGDDPHISVQSRGGPLKFELSSWLQIEGAEPGDSGTYRCIARNSLGSVSASAELGVLSAEDLSSYLANNVSEMDTMDYDHDS